MVFLMKSNCRLIRVCAGSNSPLWPFLANYAGERKNKPVFTGYT